jgi:hypothetical protein
MIILAILVPFLFLGFWVVASYLIHSEGWNDLVRRYHYQKIFIGEHLGLVSTIVNESKYKKSIALSFNKDGFYMKPVFFLLFHKPVFIPWQEAKALSETNVGLARCMVVGVATRR